MGGIKVFKVEKVSKFIGKDNLIGRLRFWYYKKRGWIVGNRFFKGVKTKKNV